jgi:hypothetical protein
MRVETHELGQGFSRLDCVATLAGAFLMCGLAMGASNLSRESGHKAGCANNLRQLGAAMLMFSTENNNSFPAQTSATLWMQILLPYYQRTNVLHCPADAAKPANFGASFCGSINAAPRSYLLNGWSDYYQLRNIPYSVPFPATVIKQPSETILFGEKETASGHFWVDFNPYDDLNELEQGRHFNTGNYENAGSNHAFADGSVRFLKFGQGLNPVVLWFVEDKWRYFLDMGF